MSALPDLASPADRKQLAGDFGFEGVGDGFMKRKNKAERRARLSTGTGTRSGKSGCGKKLPRLASKELRSSV